MKRTLTNSSSTGAQAKIIREMFADADNARHNASGGHGNSELDKLRAVNADLLAALRAMVLDYVPDTARENSLCVLLNKTEFLDMQIKARAAITRATEGRS